MAPWASPSTSKRLEESAHNQILLVISERFRGFESTALRHPVWPSRDFERLLANSSATLRTISKQGGPDDETTQPFCGRPFDFISIAKCAGPRWCTYIPSCSMAFGEMKGDVLGGSSAITPSELWALPPISTMEAPSRSPKRWPLTRVPAPPSFTIARTSRSRSTRLRKSEFRQGFKGHTVDSDSVAYSMI